MVMTWVSPPTMKDFKMLGADIGSQSEVDWSEKTTRHLSATTPDPREIVTLSPVWAVVESRPLMVAAVGGRVGKSLVVSQGSESCTAAGSVEKACMDIRRPPAWMPPTLKRRMSGVLGSAFSKPVMGVPSAFTSGMAFCPLASKRVMSQDL